MFLPELWGHINTKKIPKVIRRFTVEAIFQVMRVVVNYRKGQKQLIKYCSTSKKYLGGTTNLRPSVTRNFSPLLLQESQSASRSPDEFFVQPDKKFFGRVDKGSKKPILRQFWAINL